MKKLLFLLFLFILCSLAQAQGQFKGRVLQLDTASGEVIERWQKIDTGSFGGTLHSDSLHYLRGDLKWKTVSGGGGGVSIGDAIGGGTAGSVLFLDGSGNLAEDNPYFTYSLFSQALTAYDIIVSDNLHLGPSAVLDLQSSSGNVRIKAPAISGGWILTLPDIPGTSGDVLTTNGSGVTSWQTISNIADTPWVYFNNGNNFTYGSGNSAVAGNNNTAVGIGALSGITTSYGNVAIGPFVLPNVTSVGSFPTIFNIGIGPYAFYSLNRGDENIALGYNACYYCDSIQDYIAMGDQALYRNKGGDANISIGVNSGRNVEDTNTYFTANIFLGRDAGADGAATSHNQFFVGSGLTKITDMWLGGERGHIDWGYDVTIHAPGAAFSATNAGGGNLILAAGMSTGNQTGGGDIIFEGSPAGSSGTSDNILTELFRFKNTGAFSVNGSVGNPGQVLTSNGNAAPSWQDGGGGGSSLPDTIGHSLDYLRGDLTWQRVSGLLDFTDNFYSSSPNNVVAASQLIAKNAGFADIDAVLSSKGNGAIQAQAANGIATGGNKRGAKSVDWQMTRQDATSVAQGSHDVITGGQDNTLGDSDGLGGWNFIGGGQGNYIDSGSANIISGGLFDTINNAVNASILGGYQNTIKGGAFGAAYSSILGGSGLTLSGSNSFGYCASDGSGSDQMSVSNDGVGVFGDVDIWLANNDNAARKLYFYAPYNTIGDFPGTAKYVAFKAGVVTTSVVYTLPLADATVNGRVLTSNASATLSWASVARWVSVPASAAASGTAGDAAYDASFIYICTATNTWKRVAISTW